MTRSAPAKHDVTTSIPNFGDLLRYLRQRQQMTQRDLALAVGYSVSQISRLEHNERLPDEITLLSVFVPALGLEQEPATVERLLTLARQARSRDAIRPTLPEPNGEAAPPDQPVAQPAPCVTNLPHRLTSFLGREQEILALQRLVKEQRLVTLTGVGGVGKSSLALALGQSILDSVTVSPSNNPKSKISNLKFPDGVWLLELAAIREGGLVARLLVDLFKLPEFPGRPPLEAVIAYLQHKDLLLIVDNCEHLIATCADLVERLLQAAPKLYIVATSREALNIAGEREWPVLPLSTPTTTPKDGVPWSLTQLQPFAAAQLFMERAQAVKADLTFTDEDAPLIAHLCHQLDGLPLALELAAVRCKSFTLPEIVVRLQDRFALLSAGRRTSLLRQQTLRATIDWSYDLLSPAEAALFRCLAVFVGGWTLAAAEAVADRGQDHPPTFELLHQLVNKSLVVVDQRGETTRYRMLETIREYAGEKLRECGETETMRARHFACYLALAETSVQNIFCTRPDYWLNEVKVDLDNLRAAFAWSQTQVDRGEKSLRLATALGQFWQLPENISEGSAWLETALAHADPGNAELTSWGILWLALTLLYAAPHSFDLATEAQQRFRALNKPDGLALANLLMGIWAVARGDAAKAIAWLQDALAWFQEKPSWYFLDWTYFYLANAFKLAGKSEQALHYYRLNFQLGEDADDYVVVTAALEGIAMIDPSQAIALCQKQLGQQRRQQNQARVAALLHSLGIILTVAGELTGALAALTEGLALWQKLGIVWSAEGGIARACLDLGLVQYLRQEYQQALVYEQKAIQLYEEAGDLHGVAYACMALGYVALGVNDLTLALPSFHKCLHLAVEREINCTYTALVGLAELARRQAKPALAARLFGVTERFPHRLMPIDDRWKEAFCEPLLKVAHAQLRDGAYATAWAEGKTLPLDQAMQLALTLADPASSLAPLVSAGSDDPGLHTKRR